MTVPAISSLVQAGNPPEAIDRPFAVRFADADGPIRGDRLADAADTAIAALRDQPNHLLGHIAEWLLDQTSNNTRDAYAVDLEQFSAWALDEGLSLIDLRAADVKRWAHHLANPTDGSRPLSAATIRRRIAAMSSFYTHLVGADVLDRSPFVGVKRTPKRRTADQRPARESNPIPSREAIFAFRDAAGVIDPRWGALISLLYSSALRISEICDTNRTALTPGSPPTLTIVGKGRAEDETVDVPVDPTGHAYLTDHHTDVGDATPLILSRSGRRLSRRNAYNHLVSLGEQLLPAVDGQPVRTHPHLFRAAAATHMLEAGVPIREVQLALRHADITTTQIYDHADDRRAQKALTRLHG